LLSGRVPMTSIGETLRRERLQQGMDLQQLSQSTKIGTRMLQAMEQNDFSKLPGGVFTRSFIKQYAAALGMNPAELEEQLSLLQTDPEEPKNGPRKDVIPEDRHYSLSDYKSSRNSGSLLMSLVWVAAAVAVGGAVYYLVNRAPSAPAEPKAQVSRPTAQPETQVPEVVAAAPALPTAPQAEASASQSPVQVSLNAPEKAWVSITADGKSQFVGDMQAGEKRVIAGQERVKVVAGNAGALQILLNGKPVDAVGPKGQVRVVEFTTSGAHVVPRTPKPAPLP
jgi:cytoskeleton protein RodZ